jgi:hypothetical protein
LSKIDELLKSYFEEKSVLVPTIAISLGKLGNYCQATFQQQAKQKPYFDVSQVKFLSFHDQIGNSEAINQETTDNSNSFYFNSQSKTRLQLAEDITRKSSIISKRLSHLATNLLEQTKQERLGENRQLRVLLVGDAAELIGSVGIVQLAKLSRLSLENLIAGVQIIIDGILVLPKGTVENGAEIYATLIELSNSADQKLKEPSPVRKIYDHLFLVSQSGNSAVIDETTLKKMIVDFIFLSSDSVAQEYIYQRLSEINGQKKSGLGFVSFGLSSIYYPVYQVVREAVDTYMSKLIRNKLLPSCQEDLSSQVNAFLSWNNWGSQNFYNKIVTDKSGKDITQMEPDPLYFENVPRQYWPDRIASYDSFLETKKTRYQLTKLEENLQALDAETSTSLIKKVEEMITSEPCLDKASNFLEQLDEYRAKIAQQALRHREEAIKHFPELTKKHQKLSWQISNMPNLSALSARFFLLTVLSAFFVTRSFNLLRKVPRHYFNWNYLPSNYIAAIAVVSLLALLGWLIYKRAEAKLFLARASYLQAVNFRHSYIVKWSARRAVSWFCSQSRSKELANRGLKGLSKMIEEQRKNVDRLKKLYAEILNQVETVKPDSLSSKLNLDLSSYLPELQYKRGLADLDQEAKLFLAAGGHYQWRSLTTAKLKERLENFLIKGFKPAWQREASDLIVEQLEKDTSDRLLKQARKLSQPYLRVLPTGYQQIKLLFSQTSIANRASNDERFSETQIVLHNDKYAIIYLQLASPLRLNDLVAASFWKKAYQTYKNKSALHINGSISLQANQAKGDAQ